MTRRRLIADMDDVPTQCLYGFWTANPCPRLATWMASEWGSQWRACDDHRMRFDVPWGRTDLRRDRKSSRTTRRKHRA